MDVKPPGRPFSIVGQVESDTKMSDFLLLVAYHFPPENVVGAARPARFSAYLPRYGWRSHVLTAARQKEGDTGAVRWHPDRTAALWQGESHATPDFSHTQRYVELVLRKFVFPGALGLKWALDVPRVSAELVTSLPAPPSAVLSTFPPLAAHLAGWRTARRLGVPWVADFRDPFAPAPSFQSGWLTRTVCGALESRFMASAAAIILNTEAAASMYRARYPAHARKIHVIWNGFDPADTLGPLPVPRRPRHVLLHAGALYAGRNPTAILQSLGRLRSRGVEAARDWEVSLVGPNDCSPEEQRAIDGAIADGVASLEAAKIPQAEARRLTQEADGLLLLQPQSDVQVPGKIFEYIRIGRPILSLAPQNSPIEWILDRSGIPHVNVYPNDAPAEVDRKVLQFFALPTEAAEPSPWFVDNFNAEFQARQLAQILDRVTGNAPEPSDS